MRLAFAFSGLVLQTSLCVAQQAPSPRFYGGVQAFGSSYPIFYPGATNSYLTGAEPVELLIGYRFTPRWAVQVGWIGTRQVFHGGTTEVDPATNKTVVYSSRDDERNTAIPVLARYSLTRKVTHRVQFDVLAGVTLVHASYRRRATRLEDGQLAFDDYRTNKATNVVLCIGPSIRWALGRHVELVAHYGRNGTVNPNRSAGSTAPRLATNFANTFTGGLHYRFGYR